MIRYHLIDRLTTHSLVSVACVIALLTACGAGEESSVQPGPRRSFTDRPDDIAGPQVHVLYVTPLDGIDRGLDTNGTLTTSVSAFQSWLQIQTGRGVRFDTYLDSLDIGYLRLDSTNAAIQAKGEYVVFEIARQLQVAGWLKPNKHYTVYYEGSSLSHCGGAQWPGQVAAMYLRAPICNARLVTTANTAPGYWEFAMLHHRLHTFGIVGPDAPHHLNAHVPEPYDLMYGGTAGPWQYNAGLVVDLDGDDYFGPDVA